MKPQPAPKPRDKSKALCKGCREDYYNGTGAEECWLYKDAEVVTRFRIAWWTAPTVPGAFTRVWTLPCYNAPGEYAYRQELPDFAVDVRDQPA